MFTVITILKQKISEYFLSRLAAEKGHFLSRLAAEKGPLNYKTAISKIISNLSKCVLLNVD